MSTLDFAIVVLIIAVTIINFKLINERNEHEKICPVYNKCVDCGSKMEKMEKND